MSNVTLLIEEALRGLLTESRLDFLKSKWKSLDSSHDTVAKFRDAADIVDHFATRADPSERKAHTDHILRWYSKGQIRQEDHPKIHQVLKGFETHKKNISQKDLGRYKTFHDLQDAVSAHIESGSPSTPWGKFSPNELKTMEDGSDIVHDDNTHTVRRVHTQEAMNVLGKGTEWCTVQAKYRGAKPSGVGAESSHFDHYSTDLFHVHDKDSGNRFLVHTKSGQYMDEKDREVDTGLLASKYSGLKHAAPKDHEPVKQATSALTHPDRLHVLADDSAHHTSLAENPSVPEATLEKIVRKTPHHGVFWDLMKHPKSTSKVRSSIRGEIGKRLTGAETRDTTGPYAGLALRGDLFKAFTNLARVADTDKEIASTHKDWLKTRESLLPLDGESAAEQRSDSSAGFLHSLIRNDKIDTSSLWGNLFPEIKDKDFGRIRVSPYDHPIAKKNFDKVKSAWQKYKAKSK